MIYHINPVPKPRQTRADKWKKRPCVLRYRAFKDEIRLNRVALPAVGFKVVFTIAMPENWDEKKKDIMHLQPHTRTPDLDNLIKALLDAVYENDSHVWNIHATKRWGLKGSIAIRPFT